MKQGKQRQLVDLDLVHATEEGCGLSRTEGTGCSGTFEWGMRWGVGADCDDMGSISRSKMVEDEEYLSESRREILNGCAMGWNWGDRTLMLGCSHSRLFGKQCPSVAGETTMVFEVIHRRSEETGTYKLATTDKRKNRTYSNRKDHGRSNITGLGDVNFRRPRHS